MQSVRNNDPYGLYLRRVHPLELGHRQDSAYWNIDNDGAIEPNLDDQVWYQSQSQASDFLRHLASETKLTPAVK